MKNKKILMTDEPRWHCDAKWICGILLIILLTPTVLLLNASKLTTEENAVGIVSTSLTLMFGGEDIGSISGIQKIRDGIRASGGALQPIPGVKLYITADDLGGKTPREVWIKYFGKMAVPLYLEGKEGLIKLASSEKFKSDVNNGSLGPVEFFTKQTHDTITSIFWWMAAICGAFFALMIYFSSGVGRLVSPAVVIFITSLPGILFMKLAEFAKANPQMYPGEVSNPSDMFTYIGSNLLPIVAPSVNLVTRAMLMAAGALLALAILIKLWLLLRRAMNRS